MGRSRLIRLVTVAFLTPFGSLAYASETITYTYDALGRLVTVVHSGSINDGVLTSYTYDPADNRNLVTVTGAGAAIAINDSVNTAENIVGTGNVFDNNGWGPDVDYDGPALSVGAVNGSSANVGTSITLTSGAILTVNTNGTYSYNPNGKFNTLTAVGSGAVNTSATESFTYSLIGGGTATVTMTIIGVAGAGDWLVGSSANNVITGTAGNDFVFLQQGGDDTVTGGNGNDTILYGATLTSADLADGGAGVDQVALQGNYTALTLGTGIINMESIALLSSLDTRFGLQSTTPFDYNITTVDQNVAAGVMLTVDASQLSVGEDVTFNGSAETDGLFRVFGGSGDDFFIGSQNGDQLLGRIGNDTLNGGDGNDRLTGGVGNDVINGGSGADIAVFAGLRASYSITTNSGTIQIVDNDATTDGNDGTDTLSAVETAEFKNGVTESLAAPIILDLDGDGVEMVSKAKSNARFDWNGDGKADRTGWVGNGDGLLVFDRDHNGTVSAANELSFVDDKPGAKSDLDGLSAFDSNHDGQFSSGDDAWVVFRVWKDRDGDGKVDVGEFLTMQQAGVASIDLAGVSFDRSWQWGQNIVVNYGRLIRTDGTQGAFADAALSYLPSTQSAAARASTGANINLRASFAVLCSDARQPIAECK